MKKILSLLFLVWSWSSFALIAYTPQQASWFIDANIGGNDVAVGSASAFLTYEKINDTSLDLVINSSKGSANAEIPCAAGTPSSGLTCGASSESIGIAFYPPYPGVFDACFSFSSGTNSGGAYLSIATYQIVETNNLDYTILQEGGERIYTYVGTNNNGGYAGIKVCGSFTFLDTLKKTLRLEFEKPATTIFPYILANRASDAGQRDIKVTVIPRTKNTPMPVLIPKGGFEVEGQVSSKTVTIASGSTVDFGLSNSIQLTSATGSALTLNNLWDGGAYSLLIADGVSRTYSFTATKKEDGTALTVKCSPATSASTSGKWILFSFLRMGSTLLCGWTDAF